MLSERIRELRKASGMTQVALAKELGVTKQCVSNWENGNIQPSVDMLVRLALRFGVSTDHLLGWRRRPACAQPGSRRSSARISRRSSTTSPAPCRARIETAPVARPLSSN